MSGPGCLQLHARHNLTYVFYFQGGPIMFDTTHLITMISVCIALLAAVEAIEWLVNRRNEEEAE